jgi:hypothetical protein
MNGRPTNSGRESDVSFPLGLEFHSGMANSVSTDGGGSREGSRDNDKIATQFPSARNPHQNFPQARRGEKERGGATSESGFRMAHGKKQLRHSELHSLQEIKNQESRIERVRTKLSFVIVQQPKQNMGLPHVRATERGQPRATRKSQYKKQRL